MNVIIQIQGRAAVPVRAIPLMSYWTVMAGAELVGIFLKNGKVGEVQRLTAYQLVGGVVSPISANYWADAEIALESLSETMKAKKYSYREWQLRVLQELPEVGFVWLDELEPYFAQLCDADNDSAAEYFQTLGPEKNLVPAMLGLDYTPLTSTELELVVMQGFALAAPRALPTAPNSTEAGGTAPAQNQATPASVVAGSATVRATRQAGDTPIFSMTRAGLIEAHEHEWPTIRGDIAGAGKNGLVAAKAGTRGWCEALAMAWARAKGKLTSAAKPAAALAPIMNSMASTPSRIHKLDD